MNEMEKKEQYHKVSDKKVAYTVELKDGIVADYDAEGNVVGIDWADAVDPEHLNLDELVKLAKQSSKGPSSKNERSKPPQEGG